MILLRPWGLLLLLVPLVWLFVRRRANRYNPWVGQIDAALMPYLWMSGNTGGRRFGYRYLIPMWVMLSLAVAGPAWQKKPVPLRTEMAGNVIILDLSPAMTSDKLQTARIKLYDMLEQLQGEQVSLVLYDTQGYIAAPMTPDIGLVRDMVPVLNPTVLPGRSFHPVAGFQKAEEVLKQAGLSDGRILFITAGAVNADEVAEVVRSSPYRIGVLGVGAAQNGQPVALPGGGFLTDADGQPVVIRLGADAFKNVGVYQDAVAGEGDVRRLLATTAGAARGNGQAVQDVADVWEDSGIWFLIAGSVLALGLFRRGFLFVWVLVGMASSVSAGMWQRADQEAYAYMLTGGQAYRQGDYNTAVQAFGAAGGVEGLYNQGNALAHIGQIPAAIEAYQRVLAIDPAHADAAFNKAYLEKQQQEQQKQEEERQQQENAEQSDADKTSSGQGQNDNNSDKNEASASDSQSSEGEGNGDSANADGQQNIEQSEASNAAQPAPIPMDLTETDESADDIGGVQSAEEVFDQESREVLNRLPNDPARVLRYRIYQQYQRQGGR